MLQLEEPRAVAGLRIHRCTVFSADVVLACQGEPDVPFERVESDLRSLERRFSRFDPDNELARLNGSEGAWVEIAPDLGRLLEHALDVAVRSAGLVNIATTTALREAGYVRPWPERWEPASRARAVPVRPLTEVLDLAPGRARLMPGHQVDFGAIAKGLWADQFVERLGRDGAVSLGGDISARGRGPEGEGWPVSLPNGRTVVLSDGGLATSGTSKRRSGSAHHLIDPRTGAPARSGAREFSVLATSGSAADWLATAVLIDAAARPVREAPELLGLWVHTHDEGDCHG